MTNVNEIDTLVKNATQLIQNLKKDLVFDTAIQAALVLLQHNIFAFYRRHNAEPTGLVQILLLSILFLGHAKVWLQYYSFWSFCEEKGLIPTGRGLKISFFTYTASISLLSYITISTFRRDHDEEVFPVLYLAFLILRVIAWWTSDVANQYLYKTVEPLILQLYRDIATRKETRQ